MPPPFGSHVTGPALALFPAGNKYKPAFVLTGPRFDDPALAPTPADILTFVVRRAGKAEARAAASEAAVGASDADLYRRHDDL